MALDYCNDKNKMMSFPEGQQRAAGHKGQWVPVRQVRDRDRHTMQKEQRQAIVPRGTPVKEGGISLLIMIV